MLGRGIAPNVVLPHLARLSRLGPVVARPGPNGGGRGAGREVRLKYDRLGQSVATLSGGNQQKVVFARAVAGTPRLALLDEPTRGVDVGARADIYAMIRRLSAAGTSVVMASSDLPELIGMSDRIADPQRRAAGGDRGDRRPDPGAASGDGLWRPTVEAVA
jgi:ribose transport system ATP-binding protein